MAFYFQRSQAIGRDHRVGKGVRRLLRQVADYKTAEELLTAARRANRGDPGLLKEFPATDENGLAAGTGRVNDEGTSYGYSPFLVRRGADADDILFITFRLAEKSSLLRLIDDEELESISPAT